MKKENPVVDKSYAFALKIVKLCYGLQNEGKEYFLIEQLLRSGTSIGANVEEAVGAQADRDFFYKISIAYKEARETKYWIRILTDTGFLQLTDSNSCLKDIEELLKIIGSIQITLKSKLNLKINRRKADGVEPQVRIPTTIGT